MNKRVFRFIIALGSTLTLLPLVAHAGLAPVGSAVPQNSSTAFLQSCNVDKDYAIYEGQRFKLHDRWVPQTINSSREVLDTTYINTWNPSGVLGDTISNNNLGGLLPAFLYTSNGKPGLAYFGINLGSVITHRQNDFNYAVQPSPATTRISPLAQVVHDLRVRQMISLGGPNYTMTYMYHINDNFFTNSLTVNPDEWYPAIHDIQCQNFYIAKCGDGVRDNPNKPGDANTDGKYGILVNGQILPWVSSLVPVPAEECDGTDGVIPGYECNAFCQLVQITTAPTCTLNVNPSTVDPNDNTAVTWNINGSYTNNPQITYNPNNASITGLPYYVPTANGTRMITPTGAGTYILEMTVSNSAGSNTCTATLNVPSPDGPSCTLIPQTQSGDCGTTFTLQYSSTNAVSISNLINISGGIIQPNQAGSFSITSMTTGITTYSFQVNGEEGTDPAICSAVIEVLPNPEPECVIGVAPQTIVLGQSGVLGWGSFNTQIITDLINIPVGNVLPNISGSLVVYPTETTTYGFTAVGEACTTPAVCSTTITVLPETNPNLRIDKKLINNIAYHSGDLIGWRIDFGNNGTGIAHDVVLTDYLPVSLDYVSSQIFGVSYPVNFATGTYPYSGSIQGDYLIYSGFDLAPGQNGYLIITGRLISESLCYATMNIAYIESVEFQPPVFDSDYFLCYAPTANLTIDKTINQTEFYLNEYINFTITVTNNGPDTPQTINIGDIRPNTSCIIPSTSRASSVPMTLTNGTNPYEWTLETPLSIGQTAYLYLTGQVADNEACAGNYFNTGTLSYMINNQTTTAQDAVAFTVLGTPVVLLNFNKSIVQAGYAPGDTVIFALDYINNGSTTISSYSITDYRPGTLTFLSASPMPGSQIVVPGGLILQWYFTTPLAPGGTGRILLNGTIN